MSVMSGGVAVRTSSDGVDIVAQAEVQDSEGASLKPNCYGNLLAMTRPVGKCAAFPVGACGVLVGCLLVSVGLAAYGVTANNIARDVNPNVDGIEPRGTEVGNRDNTLKLLLFRPGDDGHRL